MSSNKTKRLPSMVFLGQYHNCRKNMGEFIIFVDVVTTFDDFSVN